VVGIRSGRRSREVVKVQTYLSLRQGFLDIYRDLEGLDDPESHTAVNSVAAQAYWHHVWDEWYIAKKLSPEGFSELWDNFFEKAVVSGYRHNALKAVLEELASKEDVGFGAYARSLIEELPRLDSKYPRSEDATHESTDRGRPQTRDDGGQDERSD
jgi:hypothetical protein